jgi:hypothetical protein
MTVRELIDKLKEFPEDMEIVNYEYADIYDAEIKEPFNDGEMLVVIS